MNLDTSLGSTPRKLRMKSPEGSAEWIQITTKMASIQIMMILAFILMTMMMRYYHFKQLEELRESTIPTPESLQRFVPDRDKLC